MQYSLVQLPENKYSLTYRIVQWSDLHFSVHTIYGNSLDFLFNVIKAWNSDTKYNKCKFVVLSTKKL